MSDSSSNRPFENLRALVKTEPREQKAPTLPIAPQVRKKPAVRTAVPAAPAPAVPAADVPTRVASGAVPGTRRRQGRGQSAVTRPRAPAAARRRDTPAASPAAVTEPAQETPERCERRVPPFELAPGLPVSEHAAELLEAIRAHQVIIVCGETGSGKTTQLPKICLMAGRGRNGLIGHTQPRRIAASSIARRIAQELGTQLGEVVGFKVRFTDRTDPGASIKLMTDGILLAETQSDPLLKKYDTIIIDEAHERSINIDFLLGYLKRLLVRRPELKVIVTSATIDAQRFAEHFQSQGRPAPVFTISGRTYPVEVRYRPIDDQDEDDDRTLMDGIADAVDELEMAGRGDILVFLPGEREIREAAETLGKRHRPGSVDILPLYARLSAEEQERIFKSGGVRRIVLATNVAETSITVPGIHYVVDTGLARVKRYSYRNKVEQLLIEPISQASADQRAGRCGRIANGICIRLFDENDWARRPAYSDPEVMRSNLAAVILRMKSLRLGEVRDFPFVQAPPARAIADGYSILSELNAIDAAGALTQTGRELARLPIDPRLSRMLLSAAGQGALSEALIIVSGLAIQDPRERPIEAQEAADNAHKTFEDTRSDFMSFLKMWDWYAQSSENKQSNRQLTEQLHRKFLSARRMHEWHDVWRQLSEMTHEAGWQINTAPATYEQLHRALLAGLLGNLGNRQLDADFRAPPFLGARGIHFWVWPGSSLSKKAGKWIMAAELVETSRLFARCVGEVEPEWIEQIGAHLLKKSWTEPHWEKKRSEVVAFERATLYGLTVYAQRRVNFAPHDPALARELFIREALVEEDYDSKAPFFEHNKGLVRDIRDIENKSRRPDVLVDESLIYAFYDAIVPAQVVGGVTFETWRRQAEQQTPRLLFLSRDELMRHDASGVTTEFFPKSLQQAGLNMALTYHFEPGVPRDGLTMAVPIFALNQVDPVRCEWLVPGMLKEKVQFLLKSLPQKLRRHCVPINQYAADFYERTGGVQQGSRSLTEALIADIREQTRVVCEKEDFKLEVLPKHLIMNFKVIDENGRQLGMGRNLAELRAQLGEQAQKTFQTLAEADTSVADDLADNITSWSFGELPELMEIERRGRTLIGHPALVDGKTSCSLEVFDEPQQAQRAHRAGLRRLFLLQMREQVRYLEKNLSALQRVQMQLSVIEPVAGSFDSLDSLREQVVAVAVEQTAMQAPWPVTQEQFMARKDQARAKLTLVGQEFVRLLESVAQQLSGVARRQSACRGWPEVLKDIDQQLRALFPKQFLLETPPEQLRHYPRYIEAICVRLDRLRNDPQRDLERMADIGRLSAPFWRELAQRRGVEDERLSAFRWLLEELRVSLFAQELRTPMPVSVKRLSKVWESIRRL